MAAQDVNAVIARAVIDPFFRQALADNPDTTLRIAAPGLSDQEAAAIKDLRPADWGNLNLTDIQNRIGSIASWIKVSTIET